MLEEVWKDIKDFEKYYQISNLGRLKSLERLSKNRSGSIVLKEKLIKIPVNNKGYCHVKLHKKGIIKNFKLHRLVAIHFIDNPENKKEVNHIDGNKENNIVSNLEWVTPKENTIHAHRTGLVNIKTGCNHYKSKLINVYDLEGNLIEQYCNAREAGNRGYSATIVCIACNGKLNKGHLYRGLVWKYVS